MWDAPRVEQPAQLNLSAEFDIILTKEFINPYLHYIYNNALKFLN
jgi:hypothetical protein